MQLPDDAAARKALPIYSGVLRYFPAALAAIAAHSVKGNQQHNIGEELFHDRSKSADELDALVRHLMDGDLGAVAWRAVSALQKKLEAEGSPIAPAARNVPQQKAAAAAQIALGEADDPMPGALKTEEAYRCENGVGLGD